MFYNLRFIDSTRFMVSLLSNFVNNLAERNHKIKFKYGHDDEKYESCIIRYKDYNCCLEY